MKKPAPDFVIVGAPKCGTTALYATLQNHPDLALSTIKEPYFFSEEYPKRREMVDPADYAALFSHARDGQLRGEASAIYLSSETAIPAILRLRPDAKFIALVRDPVEMYISWHNECLKSLDEDEKDPERAWRLQEKRAAGQIPRLCKEPGYLQYRKICSLGAQVRRLFDLVPPHQRLVLLWDDIQFYPADVHKQIAAFLSISDVGMNSFLRENTFSIHRSPLVARLARSVFTHQALKASRFRLKPFLNKLGIRPLRWLVDLSLISAPKPILSEEFRNELIAEFSEDVKLLEKLLNRDLSGWLRPVYRVRSLSA